MLLSGSKNLEIFHKDNLSFIIDLAAIASPNCTGVFGFQDFNFKIINNKLIDPENLFIDTIDIDKKIFLSGKVSPTGYSYFLNNNLIAANKSKVINKIHNFYYDFENGFLDLKNLKFFGVFNDIEIFYPENISASGLITGYILNASNQNFYLDSGSINSRDNFILEELHTGDYSPGFSGKIIIQTSGFNQTSLNKKFRLETNLFGNFGFFSKTSLISRDLESLKDSYFLISDPLYSNLDADFGENFEAQHALYYQLTTGFSEGFPLYGEKKIEINLNYSSGYTGSHSSLIFGSGMHEINFSGKITGAGFLSKDVNVIGTGKNPTNGNDYINNISESVFSEYKIVSGFAENQMVLATGTGIVDGFYVSDQSFPIFLNEEKEIKISKNIMGFGLLTGMTSGIGKTPEETTIGSGIFYYSTGEYFTGNYIHNINNFVLTGSCRGNADVNYVNTGYYSGQFSGHITGSGLLYSNNISYLSTGTIKGDMDNRIIVRNVTNTLSIGHVATGYINADINFLGFGIATGDYKNTNIYGNIVEYTGIISSDYSGFVSGSGILIASGTANLKNKYNETRVTDYIDFINYQAFGNPQNINSPENIVNYNYTCEATGFVIATGISGMIGFTDNNNIINYTGKISNGTGILTGPSEGVYSATGTFLSIIDNVFFTNTVTGFIEDRGSNYTPPTGYTGICYFSGAYPIKYYAEGYSRYDWQLESGALSGWYNRTPGQGLYGHGPQNIPVKRPLVRWGYIEDTYNLPLTGIYFGPDNSGVRRFTFQKPYKDFITIEENYTAIRVLNRDFDLSPAENWYQGSKDGYQFLYPDDQIDWLSPLSFAKGQYVQDPIIISGFWDSLGDYRPALGGQQWLYDWNSDPKTVFRSGVCDPEGDNSLNFCGRVEEIILYGHIDFTATGFMNTPVLMESKTGILISGSGFKVIKQNLTGTDFDFVTGYQKNISKLRTGNINGYEYSGWDTRTIARTGMFSVPAAKPVTGFNYSQIEFTYTGALTGELNNVLINNSSGILYTGLYLEKDKASIDLNNFSYINPLDNLNHILNLTPISNLSGSGFGFIPCTGFYVINSAKNFSKENPISESGNFIVTGFNSQPLQLSLNYVPENSGIKNASMALTGIVNNPRILNQAGVINNTNILGTGFLNDFITGSGYVEKIFNINNISGNTIIGTKLSGEHVDIRPIDFYISGNAIDGIINYNNTATKIFNNTIYSGYVGEVTGVKEFNFNEIKIITGFLDNPLTYEINFQNSYSLATGYYDTFTNSIKYKNLDFINGKYHGSGVLPKEIKKLFIKTNIKNYRQDGNISAQLSISGITGYNETGVIILDYMTSEGN